MGTRFQTTACPLCSDEFDDPLEFKDHLAFMHDLVDDDGAETTLDEVPPEPEPEPDPAPIPAALVAIDAAFPARPAAVPRPALTGPVDVHVDRRVLPGLVIAVALQLVVGLLGLAVVDGGSAEKVTTAAGANSPAAGNAPGATPPAPTTAAPAVDTRNDQARADLITLRASDFPAGWRAIDPSSLDDGSDDSDEGCTAANDPTETDAKTGEAASALDHDANMALGGSFVLRTEQDAIRTMAVIREVTACLGDLVITGAKQGLPAGVNVSHGAFSSLGYPTYADESIALSMPVTFAGGGVQVPLRVDVLAIRRDRAVTYVLIMIAANELTPIQERGMLSAVADRMAPRAI